MNSFLLQIEEENVQKGNIGSELGFSDFRERVCLLSRFPAVRTVSSRRSKKQSRSFAARATRGHRFCGVPTTPRGRGLLLLVLFFG